MLKSLVQIWVHLIDLTDIKWIPSDEHILCIDAPWK